MANVTHQYAASNAFGDDPTPRGVSDVKALSFSLDIGTDNLGAGDLWKFVTFNERVAIHSARLEVTDLDSNATPTLTLDLGYDLATGVDDDDYFLANSNIGQAGGAAQSAAAFFAPQETFTVQAKVETAAATAAAGKATLTLLVGPIEDADS